MDELIAVNGPREVYEGLALEGGRPLGLGPRWHRRIDKSNYQLTGRRFAETI